MPTPTTPQSIEPSNLAKAIAAGEDFRILDVRRAPAFEKNPVLLPGAVRVPPDTLGAWAAGSTADRSVPLVVYCVYGHEVSQGAAAELSALGFDVRYLAGGISEWQSVGGITVAG